MPMLQNVIMYLWISAEEQNKNVSTAEQQDIRSEGTEFLRKTMVPAGQNKDFPNETQDPEKALLELCPD